MTLPVSPLIANDAAKLRTLADWFDMRDDRDDASGYTSSREVQADLRRIARDVSGTAVLSAQTGACRALNVENERLKAENAALRDDGGELLGEVYTTDGVGIVMRTITRVRAERDAALAKLKLPCGSCHPCLNWADETWRREGRKPPTVQAWEDTTAELVAALATATRWEQRAHDLETLARTDAASMPTCPHGDPSCPCQEHTRGWAGYGVDVGQHSGAYCVECSDIAQDYVWPCAAVPTEETP